MIMSQTEESSEKMRTAQGGRMNAYMNSYNKIESAYSPRRSARRRRFVRRVAEVADRLLTFIDVIIDALSSERVARAVKVGVTTVCFFAVIGVVGGIESGTIGWVGGFIWSSLIAGVEFTCLKGLK